MNLLKRLIYVMMYFLVTPIFFVVGVFSALVWIMTGTNYGSKIFSIDWDKKISKLLNL